MVCGSKQVNNVKKQVAKTKQTADWKQAKLVYISKYVAEFLFTGSKHSKHRLETANQK